MAFFMAGCDIICCTVCMGPLGVASNVLPALLLAKAPVPVAAKLPPEVVVKAVLPEAVPVAKPG
jgi:hypothetical protein